MSVWKSGWKPDWKSARAASVSTLWQPRRCQSPDRPSQRAVPSRRHASTYAWADRPSSTDEYTPHGFYQYTSSGYEATTASFGVGLGRYLMSFHAVDLNNGNVQVTAYGSGQEFCAVNSWSGSNVQVQCYDWDGTPVDTYYTVAFTGL